MPISGLSGGQQLDSLTGEIQPWYTPGALDEIREWDLKGKVVLEWGAGASTLWWAKRCRHVFAIETAPEWCEWVSAQVAAQGLKNITVVYRPVTPRTELFAPYTDIPEGCSPDIVVIDGIQRLACLKKALLLTRPFTIIFDNWQQENAFISPEAEALMKRFVGASYPEVSPWYEKHPWQTAIWHLKDEKQHDVSLLLDRSVHIHDTPLLQKVFSGKWDPAAVERQYIDRVPGITVVDDFLSNEALENLRLLCFESAIWSSSHSMLQHPGPVLLRIAQELREALPHILGERNPLRHLHGYKIPSNLKGGRAIHADFAAVNVKFWITPDEANSGEAGAGLVIYGAGSTSRQQMRALTIPHQQNRAVIFNSDLFHGTSALYVGPDYEHQRIDITMLYGEKEVEIHHQEQQPLAPPYGLPMRLAAWRSQAFSCFRRPK
jgi:hypothetical protein